MFTVYFSLDLKNRKATKLETREVQASLKDLRLKSFVVIGCYKDETETSFKVEIKSNSDLKNIKNIASRYGQESILVVDVNSRAILHFLNSNVIEPIGTFLKVSKDEAANLDAWTYVAHTNEFYACKGA